MGGRGCGGLTIAGGTGATGDGGGDDASGGRSMHVFSLQIPLAH